MKRNRVPARIYSCVTTQHEFFHMLHEYNKHIVGNYKMPMHLEIYISEQEFLNINEYTTRALTHVVEHWQRASANKRIRRIMHHINKTNES